MAHGVAGAYLGDKLSPESETTALTAQMVEVDAHQHIKRQAWTSVPAFLIALVVFLVIGLVRGPEVHDTVATTVELTKLGDIYRITPLNLLPLLLLAVLSIRKLPPSLALLFAALFAGVLGAFLQPEVMRDFVGGSHHRRGRAGPRPGRRPLHDLPDHPRPDRLLVLSLRPAATRRARW